MTSINKKRIRIPSPTSTSDDEDHRNPNNGDACGGKSNTCYVCDGNDNWVLLCHGEDCPVAIHQSCNSDEPDFDEFGSFYCPYCWYKRVVVKSLKLRKKVMVIGKSRNGVESLGGVGSEVSEDIENVVEVNGLTSVGNTREVGEGTYEKFVAMEKDQRVKEVAAETCSPEVFENGDDDVDEGRQQRGRVREKNHETSDAGEERKEQTRCDINHETARAHSFEVGVKTSKQRIYSEKNQKIKRVLKTHKRGVFINDDEGTQVRDSDLREGRSGQGGCYSNNQQKKASSTESCSQEVHRTDKRVSHDSELRDGRHNKKNRRNETIETETQDKEVSKDRERMREQAVERDRDDFYLAENEERQCQVDMRNDDASFDEQENGFRKDEHVDQNSVSSSISSPVSTENRNDANAASQDLAMIIHPMAGLEKRPTKAQPIDAGPIDARPVNSRPYCSVSSKKRSFQPEKYGQKSHQEKNGASSNDPGQRKSVLWSDRKRKRLFWTPAEEEMLRVGVEKFPGVRNIPWRKILEFGRDVFNCERVPTDLKDKWKNMNKTSTENEKWVSLSTERQPNH